MKFLGLGGKERWMSFVMNFAILSSVPIFEAQEDGAVVEEELAVILKTALGIADFAVCDLFRTIDCQNTGKITFGRTIYIVLHVKCDVAFRCAGIIEIAFTSSLFVVTFFYAKHH